MVDMRNLEVAQVWDFFFNLFFFALYTEDFFMGLNISVSSL